MDKETKSTLTILATIIGLVLFVLPFFMEPTTHEETYDDAVSVFPVESTSKNYRLTAYIRITRYYRPVLYYYNEYEVRSVTWPNGGTVDADCNDGKPFLGDRRVTCIIGDDYYYLELNDPQEYPTPS